MLFDRSLGSISVLFGQIIRGMSAGARVFEYMTIIPTIPVTGGKILPISDVKGQVEFENITFTYPTRKGHVVLKNFSLSIERGRMVALCGPSGSGKSTVAALLERFYEVGKGRIMLDGHDVKDLDPTWMRGAVIGYIHQVRYYPKNLEGFPSFDLYLYFNKVNPQKPSKLRYIFVFAVGTDFVCDVYNGEYQIWKTKRYR